MVYLGADITDYFNYGFTEDTWQAYCSRQRRMRVNESGAGLPAGPGGSSHHYNRTSQINSSAMSNGKISEQKELERKESKHSQQCELQNRKESQKRRVSD